MGAIGVFEIIIGALLLILALAIIVVVLFQQSHRKGISGVISGGADTFLSKNKAKTADAMLGKLTVFLAVAFIVLSIVETVLATVANNIA